MSNGSVVSKIYGMFYIRNSKFSIYGYIRRASKLKSMKF